jgi:hypothetical protein
MAQYHWDRSVPWRHAIISQFYEGRAPAYAG